MVDNYRTGYRKDVVAGLMETVRQHQEHLNETYGVQPQRVPNSDDIAVNKAHDQAPAHPLLNVGLAYTHNLQRANFSKPEAFSRQPPERPVVHTSKAPESHLKHQQQAQQGYTGLHAPNLPGWVDPKLSIRLDALKTRQKAFKWNESCGRPAQLYLSPKGPKSAKEAAKWRQYALALGPTLPVTAKPKAKTPANVTVEVPMGYASPVERTEANYQYDIKESFFARMVQGAEAESGEGKVSWHDPDGTLTYIKPKK